MKKKFGTAYAASECVKVFDGRFFGGRKLSCHFWDGVTNYTVKVEDEKEEVWFGIYTCGSSELYSSTGHLVKNGRSSTQEHS